MISHAITKIRCKNDNDEKAKLTVNSRIYLQILHRERLLPLFFLVLVIQAIRLFFHLRKICQYWVQHLIFLALKFIGNCSFNLIGIVKLRHTIK